MQQNNYNVTIEKEGVLMSASGPISNDEVENLVTGNDGRIARVNMAVSESREYGSLKVSASVTLDCDQKTSTIERAGSIAMNLAIELMVEGFERYGIKAGPE